MGKENLGNNGVKETGEHELNFSAPSKASKRLVVEAQKGSEEALNRLIEIHYKDMLYFAMKQVGREDGQDVTQKAIERIIKKLSDLNDPAKFKAWAMRAVHHECVDLARKKKRQSEQVKVVELHDESQRETVENRSGVFDVPFAADIENEKLVAILDEMPQRFSNCIRLRYLEDMSYAEIAEALDIDITKVKNDLHRGMKLLEQRIEEEGGQSSFLAAGPAVAIPFLTHVLQEDQAALLDPSIVEQGMLAAQQLVAAQYGASAAGTSAAGASVGAVKQGALGLKIALGSTAAAVATAGAVLAFTSSDPEPEPEPQAVSVVEPSPVPEPVPAPEPPKEEPISEPEQDAPINTIADMIGEAQAEKLASFEENGTDAATWEAFLEDISAEPDMVSNNTDYQYSSFILIKQDKQLILADKRNIGAESSLDIRARFGPDEGSPSQMAVIFMFE